MSRRMIILLKNHKMKQNIVYKNTVALGKRNLMNQEFFDFCTEKMGNPESPRLSRKPNTICPIWSLFLGNIGIDDHNDV